VSRTLFLINVVVGALGCLFAVGIVRDVVTHRSLPPAPAPRATQSTLDPGGPPAAPQPLASFQVIATKNMFSPGRTEASGGLAAAPGGGPRPILHGVLIDGERSRAYLEEPPAPQVFGFAVGDQVGGGRLEAIEPDRVVIVRPQGRIEVFLQDPSKPRQVTPAAAGPPGQPPGQVIRVPSSSGRVTTPRPPQRPQ